MKTAWERIIRDITTNFSNSRELVTQLFVYWYLKVFSSVTLRSRPSGINITLIQ